MTGMQQPPAGQGGTMCLPTGTLQMTKFIRSVSASANAVLVALCAISLCIRVTSGDGGGFGTSSRAIRGLDTLKLGLARCSNRLYGFRLALVR